MAKLGNINQLIRRVERMREEMILLAEELYVLADEEHPPVPPKTGAPAEITVKGKKVKL